MKVIMLGRIGLLKVGGGDKVQIINTAEKLREMGIEVDIADDLKVDLSPYDIVHIFQLDWGSEAYFYAKEAKRLNKPIVLSPIHHLFSELKKFDDLYVFDYRRIARILFKDQFHRDVFKNIFRALFDFRKIKPTIYSAFFGLKKMHQEALRMADIVLVQTEMEAEDLKNVYGVNFLWQKAPNGVGEQFMEMSHLENLLNINNYVICVGRIEPRKNQLNIIKAIEQLRIQQKSDIKLVLIGAFNYLNHAEYSLHMLKEIRTKEWITYIPKVEYSLMPSYYRYAKVCISASWFESTGLTLLEGLFCGANIVSSSEPTKEYLTSYASYCDPADVTSIKDAIIKELNAKPPQVDPLIRTEYTWINAAKKTREVYMKLLSQTI